MSLFRDLFALIVASAFRQPSLTLVTYLSTFSRASSDLTWSRRRCERNGRIFGSDLTPYSAMALNHRFPRTPGTFSAADLMKFGMWIYGSNERRRQLWSPPSVVGHRLRNFEPQQEKPPLQYYCRFKVSFFSFFASFFSLGVLVATFFCAFLASWVLLMMSSYVESRSVRRDVLSLDQHTRF